MTQLEMQQKAFQQRYNLLHSPYGGASALSGLGGLGQMAALQNDCHGRPIYTVTLERDMQIDLDKYLKDWDK